MNDASSMIANLMQVLPDLMAFFNAVVSILGVALFIAGVIKLAQHAKGRDSTRLSTPAMYMLSGVMLWNMGMAATSFLETFFGAGTTTDSLMAYTSSERMPEQTDAFLKLLIMCVRVYGYFAFARGWWKVKNIGAGTQASEGAFGSAFWHIAAGTMAINIVATVNTITTTLGFGDVL